MKTWTREEKKGINFLGIYGFTTNKVSENFTSVQIKMTDLPAPSLAPADPAPADLNTPAPNQPAPIA